MKYNKEKALDGLDNLFDEETPQDYVVFMNEMIQCLSTTRAKRDDMEGAISIALRLQSFFIHI